MGRTTTMISEACIQCVTVTLIARQKQWPVSVVVTTLVQQSKIGSRSPPS